MSLLDYSKFVLNEKKSSKNATKVDVPDALQEAIDAEDKGESFSFFLSSIPDSIASKLSGIFQKAANNPKSIKEFVSGLHSYDSVESAAKDMPSYYNSGIGSDIMALSADGIGRGEALVSWLVKGAEIQGSSEDFDIRVTINKKDYEVKDYRGGNAPIRLAVKSQVAWNPVQEQLVKTINLLENLKMTSGGIRPFAFEEHFEDKDFLSAIEKILQRAEDVKKGSFGIKDRETFKVFYEKAASVKYIENQYTVVELRGSGVKPRIFSITPITPEQADSGTFNVQIVNSKESETDIIVTNLRRVEYARNPKAFEDALQAAVDRAVSHADTIVFRDSGAEVDPDFVFYSVSQGRMKIIEKRLASKATDSE